VRENIGIIDLGSNSVRLIVMETDLEKRAYNLVKDVKEMVRLSAGMGSDGVIKPKAIQHTKQTLHLFRAFAQANNVTTMLPIATAAVRTAANRDEFLEEILRDSYLDFRVLTGDEEAEYGFLGVCSTMDLRGRRGVMIDVGGGSTEIGLFENGALLERISIPFGAVNLTEQFRTHVEPDRESLGDLRRFVRKQLDDIGWLNGSNCQLLIGIGGSIRNVVKIHREGTSYPLSFLHNYELSYDDVTGIIDHLSGISLLERRRLPGLSPERADVIIAGGIVLEEIMSYTGAGQLWLSGYGLREGVFLDFLRQEGVDLGEEAWLADCRNIMMSTGIQESHARQVHRLSLLIYDRIKELVARHDFHGRKLLEVAALLHDAGVSINYYQHYRHTLSVLAGRGIKGLSHRDVVLCAFIAALHERSRIYAEWVRYKPLICEDDILPVRQLGMIIRLAESLDRSHCSAVHNLGCTVDHSSRWVDIRVISMMPADLEVMEAVRQYRDFEELFGYRLSVTFIN